MTDRRRVDEDDRPELSAAEVGYSGLTWLTRTDSTNADLRVSAFGGAPSGTVLVADHQAAGRGRHGRRWSAPPGTSIAMSVLFRPPDSAASRWTWLPLIAGMAVVDGLAEVAAGVAFRLKWPNDVRADERKVCGILAERVDTPDGPACVLGMGINVGMTAAEIPVPTATSLAILVGPERTPGSREVVAAVLRHLSRHYDAWVAASDPVALAAGYRSRSETIGRRVRVLLAAGRVVDEVAQTMSVEGIARGVDPDGRLLVETSDGRVQAFAAGDVEHLR